MRFEAKKKALAAAVKIVRSMTDALALSGSGVDPLYLIAEGKVVRLRTVSGGQVVESTLTEDAQVQQEGAVAVDPGSLSSALAISGDNFKAHLDNQYLDFACGRAKGRIEVKINAGKGELPDGIPKPTVSIPGFKSLLRSISIKSGSKTSEDRSLHFDAKALTLRGESTDTFRGVSTVAPLSKGEKLPGSGSIALPAKAVDALSFLIEDCLIGFDEKFFTVKSPGLFVSMPQSTNAAIDIAGQFKDILAEAPVCGEVTVSPKELRDALADAMAMSTDKSGSRLTISFSPDGGTMTGEGAAGKIETEFNIIQSNSPKVLTAQVAPAYMQECLALYLNHEQIKLTLYSGMVCLDLVSSDALLSSQMTIIPLVAEVTQSDAPSAKKKEPEPPAKPKPAAKAKKPAPVEEDEAPPPPKAPEKKPAAKAKDPEPEEDEDDDDAEDFDDEE